MIRTDLDDCVLRLILSRHHSLLNTHKMETETRADVSSDHDHDKCQSQSGFGATWAATVTDSTHFLPTLPLKHIPRAWERKPQSPAVAAAAPRREAKVRVSRKIWRRHDFPLSRPVTAAKHANPLSNSRMARIKTPLTASPSPRKITKKLCLHTSSGQSGSAKHWDQKASTPMRTS